MSVQYHESDVKHHKPSNMQNQQVLISLFVILIACLLKNTSSKTEQMCCPVLEHIDSVSFRKLFIRIRVLHKARYLYLHWPFCNSFNQSDIGLFLCCQMWSMYCWSFRSTRVHPFSGIHVARSLALCVCFVEHILCSVLFSTILLFVLHWLTAYYYPCGIFKLFVFTEMRRQMV